MCHCDKAYLQMDEDAEKVMQVIEEFAGVLPFGDKASPEVIRERPDSVKMLSNVRWDVYIRNIVWK